MKLYGGKIDQLEIV